MCVYSKIDQVHLWFLCGVAIKSWTQGVIESSDNILPAFPRSDIVHSFCVIVKSDGPSSIGVYSARIFPIYLSH